MFRYKICKDCKYPQYTSCFIYREYHSSVKQTTCNCQFDKIIFDATVNKKTGCGWCIRCQVYIITILLYKTFCLTYCHFLILPLLLSIISITGDESKHTPQRKTPKIKPKKKIIETTSSLSGNSKSFSRSNSLALSSTNLSSSSTEKSLKGMCC